MKIKILDRIEDSNGQHVFKFEKGEVVDTETDERESNHPNPGKRVKLKDVDWQSRAEKLIRLGLARKVD